MTQARAIDEAWRPVAEAARECIGILGHPVAMLRCMPGEDQAGCCPGNVAMHALSYFAVLRAIVDHQILHLDPPPAELSRIYLQAQSDIDCSHR